MTPTEKAKRADALYYATESTNRRSLCEMIANREADLEDARESVNRLMTQRDERLARAEADNAKLRELVRDMCKAFMHGNCYRWCEFKEPCNYISDGRCQWYDRMRELGVDA